MKAFGIEERDQLQVSSGLNRNFNIFDWKWDLKFHIYFYDDSRNQLESLKAIVYYNKQNFDEVVFLEKMKESLYTPSNFKKFKDYLIQQSFDLDPSNNDVLNESQILPVETLMLLLGMKNQYKAFFSGTDEGFYFSPKDMELLKNYSESELIYQLTSSSECEVKKTQHQCVNDELAAITPLHNLD